MTKFIAFPTLLLLSLTLSFGVFAQPLSVSDLSISQTVSTNPAVAGASFDYILTVNNAGPDAANAVQVVAILPTGLSHNSNTAACLEAPLGTLTCQLGLVSVGESREISMSLYAPPNMIHNVGAPLNITNTVSVTNLNSSDQNL